MKNYTVAVLGATGAVGQEMIKILQERNFPVGKLIPLASARSAGKTLKFNGEDVVIQEACNEAFTGVDIVLGAAENDIAKQFAPAIIAAGAVFVDNSSAFLLSHIGDNSLVYIDSAEEVYIKLSFCIACFSEFNSARNSVACTVYDNINSAFFFINFLCCCNNVFFVCHVNFYVLYLFIGKISAAEIIYLMTHFRKSKRSFFTDS